MLYIDNNGNSIELDNKFASAGEADIFRVKNAAGTIAKIYKSKLSETKKEKLKFISKSSYSKLSTFISTPQKLLFNPYSKEISGFTMPFIEGYSILKLIQPRERIKFFPKSTWKHLIYVAKNCCVGFDKLHENGIIMGDVNESNILVKQDGVVNFIDFDSYQFKFNNSYFSTDVGVALWTPPELQSKNLQGLIRNENHDNFGLGLLIFQLLFMGFHPYAGIPIKNIKGPEEYTEKYIEQYRYAYSHNNQILNISPPANSIDINIVPDNIRSLFEKTFLRDYANYRPTPKDWYNALSKIETTLCQKDNSHIFSNHLNYCPWCNISKKGGHTYFLGDFITSNPNLNLDFKILSIKNQLDNISNLFVLNFNKEIIYPSLNIEPQKIDLPKIKFSKFVIPNLFVLVSLILFLTNVFEASYFSLCIVFYIFLIVWLIKDNEYNKELSKRKQVFKYKEKEFSTNLTKYEATHTAYLKIPQNFKDEISSRILELNKKFYDYEQLKFYREKLINDYKKNMYDHELKNYLSSKLIENARIEGIGEKRTQILRIYGIESALDVNPYINVPGIGDQFKSRLLYWKQNLIDNFTYNPNKGIPVDIKNKIEYEVNQLKKKAFDELEIGFQYIKSIRNKKLMEKEQAEILMGNLKTQLISINDEYQIAKANYEINLK